MEHLKIDKLAFYSLGLKDLAKECKLGPNKTLAIVRHLKIQDDPECFAEIDIGRMHFKRYSHIALDRLRKAMPTLNLDTVWAQHAPKGQIPLWARH